VNDQIKQLATFGAGCFWGVEEEFRRMPGVLDTAVGYEGGHLLNPTYKDVCTNASGHAEVVQVEFDPSLVSYQTLVEAFFELHDPTTLNRQGPDFGTQYRSAIFTHSPEQVQIATQVKERLTEAKRFNRPIVTEITPAQTFYRAEEYHQQYLAKRGLSSCKI
jgi:peptide-methionine (S)-S-oxide reductase